MLEQIINRRWMKALSAVAFWAMLLRPLNSSIWIAAVVVCLISLFLFTGEERPGTTFTGFHISLGILISAAMALICIIIWLRTKRIVSLNGIDREQALPYCIAAGICAVLSVPFISHIIVFFTYKTDHTCRISAGRVSDYKLTDHFILLVAAAVAVTLCSASSPLYPLNDWVDANCFFTVGKSMLFGKIPYRDLYEQKGPLLYGIYALAYPVSHTGFTGIWLMEIIAAYAFLVSADRCCRILVGRKSYVFLFLCAVLVYTSPAFLKGGSAEEFCLPLAMLSIVLSTRVVIQDREIHIGECFWLGVCMGAVLWIKYSMLGLFAGCCLVPFYQQIRKGGFKSLCLRILMILTGICVISIPVLLYFMKNHALADLWEAYFYNNLFVYGKSSSWFSVIKALLSGGASALTYNDSILLLLPVALLLAYRRRELRLLTHSFLSFLFAFVLIYAGGINMKYYSEILCAFLPLFLAIIWREIGGGVPDPVEKRVGLRIAMTALLTVSLLFTENRELRAVEKEQMPQFVFARIIEKTPNATLFNYGALDIGQYTVSDIVPSCRYFCMLNLPSEEMFQEMDRYMSEGVTDYIVSRGLTVESPEYVLIEQMDFRHDGTVYPYYLYCHKDVLAEGDFAREGE